MRRTHFAFDGCTTDRRPDNLNHFWGRVPPVRLAIENLSDLPVVHSRTKCPTNGTAIRSEAVRADLNIRSNAVAQVVHEINRGRNIALAYMEGDNEFRCAINC